MEDKHRHYFYNIGVLVQRVLGVVCECDWYVMMSSLPYAIGLFRILLYKHLVLYLI